MVTPACVPDAGGTAIGDDCDFLPQSTRLTPRQKQGVRQGYQSLSRKMSVVTIIYSWKIMRHYMERL